MAAAKAATTPASARPRTLSTEFEIARERHAEGTALLLLLSLWIPASVSSREPNYDNRETVLTLSQDNGVEVTALDGTVPVRAALFLSNQPLDHCADIR